MRTKRRKIGFFSVIYGIFGTFLAIVCVLMALMNMNASPVLLQQPQAALDQVNTMLDALCAGDYDTVSDCLYGQPNLGLDREAGDPVGQLFWNAMAESFDCEIRGDFHATDSGVALDVVIRAMDLESVTANLRERAKAQLEQNIAEVEDLSEIYDENYDYREDFVMKALYQAAEKALAEDARNITWELTLNLVYENGRWWIMPDQNLLRAISGGVLK